MLAVGCGLLAAREYGSASDPEGSEMLQQKCVNNSVRLRTEF